MHYPMFIKRCLCVYFVLFDNSKYNEILEKFHLPKLHTSLCMFLCARNLQMSSLERAVVSKNSLIYRCMRIYFSEKVDIMFVFLPSNKQLNKCFNSQVSNFGTKTKLNTLSKLIFLYSLINPNPSCGRGMFLY